MKSHAYALVLLEHAPQELLALMAEYLQDSGPVKYILCSDISTDGYFVLASAIKDNDYTPWPVHIPPCFVAAIAGLSQEKLSAGFLPLIVNTHPFCPIIFVCGGRELSLNPITALSEQFQKFITEHGSATILRDHLALFKDQVVLLEKKAASLESENAVLKSENAILAAENGELKSEAQNLAKENAVLANEIQEYKNPSHSDLINESSMKILGDAPRANPIDAQNIHSIVSTLTSTQVAIITPSPS